MEFQKPAFKYSKPVKKDIKLPDVPKKRLRFIQYAILVFVFILVIQLVIYFIGSGNEAVIGIPGVFTFGGNK